MIQNLFSLAIQGILRRRKSSILLLSILTISFAFSIVSLSLVGSISKTNTEFRRNTYGQWYFAIPSGAESDEAWLKKQAWITGFGTARSYGTIQTPTGQAGFGTVDQELIDIGRLKLDSGKFPEQNFEIVMEQNVLNSLGYNTVLGQEITLSVMVPYGDQSIPVERTYTLCGVLHEYSDLWVLNQNRNGQLLISAVVTQADAEEVYRIVQEAPEADVQYHLAEPIPQYFLDVLPEDRDAARNTINDYLASTRTPDSGDQRACENAAAYPEAQSADYDYFYIYMITAITFVAVLCVSVMQISGEIHRFTVLRSIGMTKLQLGALLSIETLLLAFPAALLGVPCGAGATWLALRLLLYSGSVPIQIAIPFEALSSVLLLWLASILISRTALFIVALRTPLTGRMQLSSRRNRLVLRLRGLLIILLVSAFSSITVITALDALGPAYLREYWGLCPTYTIWKDQLVSENEVNLIRQIPGISRIDGFGEMTVQLSYPGFEEQEVLIYAIDANGWKESLDFGDVLEEFQAGERVLLCIPEDMKEECAILKDAIHLQVLDKKKVFLAEVDVPVSIQSIPPNAFNRGLIGFNEPNTIFCSECFVQKLLDSMEPGMLWDKYVSGEAFGYDRVYANANLSSDNLSTDLAMANFCNSHGLTLDNRRQQFQALVQENVQTLVQLYSAWLCIGLIVLLILLSALSLEAEQEKVRYGILRAIGLSLRQMQRQVFGKAFFRSITGLAVGWSAFTVYAVIRRMDGTGIAETLRFVLEDLRCDGCGWTEILAISAICLIVPMAVMLLSKRSLKKGELVL